MGGKQARQVAGAVADDRQRFLGERGEHQFALLAVGQHFAGIGVDDLRIEMVFPDHRAVLALDAFAGHARAHHLGEPVDVDRVDAGLALDLAAHRLGPGFGAEDADLQRSGRRVDALALHFLDDHLHVAGRDHDDVGLEVVDQLHLLLGLPAGHRDDGAAGALGAVVRAEAAGEEAVAVGDMHDVARPPACGADRARDQVGPGVDVVLRVAHHRRLAGRARGGMDAADLLARHGEEAEGVVVAQVLLHREGKLRQVAELLQVARVDALRIEGLAVVRDVLVGMLQGRAQARELQRGDLVAAGGFDRLEVAGGRLLHRHRCLLIRLAPRPACP